MLFQELVERVWQDPELKAQLLDDTRACLEKLGIHCPPDIEIRFHENSASTMHLVLPDERTTGDDPKASFGAGLDAVLERIRRDGDFAERLHEAPGDAIAEVTGIATPAGIRLIVHRDGPNVCNFVIPLNPGAAELSEFNRYLVAGSMLQPRPGR